MIRSTLDRLRDIVEWANLAAQHARDLDARSLAATPGARDATLFCLAVACEAASHLPAEMKALAPQIPWSQVRSTRNYIIHGYWQIDFQIIVGTIAHDLEPLKAAAFSLMNVVEADRQ